MAYSIPNNASIPPKIGEYGYFLSKYFNNNNYQDNRNLVYYAVKIENHPQLIVPCHYSIDEYIESKPFKVSWGKIIEVIENKQHTGNKYNNFNYS